VELLALYTGGKDSHYAMIKAVEEGHTIKCIATAEPARADSYMFHAVNTRWARLHAEAMGIPHYFIPTSGVKEKEVEELGAALASLARECGVEGISTGAIASRYQKERVDKLAERLGLRHYAPLWGRDQAGLLFEEVSRESFVIVAAMAMGLGEEWLGRRIGPEEAERLVELARRYGFSPVGEGGEYESFVVESPLFRGRRVEIRRAKKVWSPAGWGYLAIEDAALI
jgi:ABC transporter with metal-binding/Fe-S-binding domain ATP-binding protein